MGAGLGWIGGSNVCASVALCCRYYDVDELNCSVGWYVLLYVCLFALSEFNGFMVWFTIPAVDSHWQYYIVDDCSS